MCKDFIKILVLDISINGGEYAYIPLYINKNKIIDIRVEKSRFSSGYFVMLKVVDGKTYTVCDEKTKHEKFRSEKEAAEFIEELIEKITGEIYDVTKNEEGIL